MANQIINFSAEGNRYPSDEPIFHLHELVAVRTLGRFVANIEFLMTLELDQRNTPPESLISEMSPEWRSKWAYWYYNEHLSRRLSDCFFLWARPINGDALKEPKLSLFRLKSVSGQYEMVHEDLGVLNYLSGYHLLLPKSEWKLLSVHAKCVDTLTPEQVLENNRMIDENKMKYSGCDASALLAVRGVTPLRTAHSRSD